MESPCLRGPKQPMRRRINKDVLITTWTPERTKATQEYKGKSNVYYEEVRTWFKEQKTFDVRHLANHCQCTEYTIYRWLCGRAPKRIYHAAIASFFAQIRGLQTVNLFAELQYICKHKKNVIQ